MIEEAGGLVLSGFAPLEVRLKLEFDDGARDVLVNRVQIQQVIINLIRNAFEAMADQEPRQVTLATRTLDDDMIEIAVADIGPEFPATLPADCLSRSCRANTTAWDWDCRFRVRLSRHTTAS